MKKILIILVALILSACETESEHIDGMTSRGSSPTVCINGVVYYTFGYQFAPAFGRDSKVILCEEKEVDKNDQK